MRPALLSLLALAAVGPPARAADFFFKDGDVVVMIGDSITEQHLYSNYVEMWTVTRFPNWKLTFRNTGIGGDTSTGGNTRTVRDVLSFRPTAVTVTFGMNDAGYQAFDQTRFDNYVKGLQGMIDQLAVGLEQAAAEGWQAFDREPGGRPGEYAIVHMTRQARRTAPR